MTSGLTGDVVVLVNRCDEELTVRYDGRSFILKPGENHVDRAIAGHARRQHRIMGTEDPSNPLDFESLVAIRENGDDESPAKQSKKVEALDRKLVVDPASKGAVVVKVGKGRRRDEIAGTFTEDAGFQADAGA